MEFVTLNNGQQMPMVGFGTWQILGSQCETCVRQALDQGYRLIDTARMYENEEAVGRGIRASGVAREEIFLTTKVFQPDNSYAGTRAAIDQSLLRLGIDYIDLFLIHEPYDEDKDMIRAMEEALEAGKIRAIGISNYNKEQTIEAAKLFKELGTPFVINQRKYSMFVRDIETDGLKDYAAANGIGIITFCPLAQGLLTDRYINGIPEDSRIRTDGRFLKENAITEETLGKIRALGALAAERGQTLAQMALSWILRDGDITSVLIGASRPAQILDNVGMLKNLEFSTEERQRIEDILK